MKKSAQVKKFRFPKPVKSPKLKSILDLSLKGENAEKVLSATGKRNLKVAQQKFLKKGIDIMKKAAIVDIAASPSRPNSMMGCLPCLTATRAAMQGFWISGLQRPLGTVEMAKAQGMSVADMPWKDAMTKVQLRHAIGNAMTQSVLEHLLPRLLASVGM